jgi:uncharacterized protein
VLVNRIVHEVLDRHALPRLFDELLWRLRRAGVPVSPAQAIDWVRAVNTLGLARREPLRAAFVVIVAKERAHVPVAERVFDTFFERERFRGNLYERLAARGASASEVEEVRQRLAELAQHGGGEGDVLGVAVHRGASFDRLLGLAGARIERQGLGAARGWLVEQARTQLGMKRAKDRLGLLRARLVDAFGDARGADLAAMLEDELRAAEADVKAMVDARRAAREERERSREQRLATKGFASLSAEERAKVRRAVKLVAEKMAGAERVKRRHAARGRFDARATVRRGLRTGGVPFEAVFRRRRRGKPMLFLLCDVSDSVRGAAELLLEVVQSAQSVFAGTRSFVFVRDLGEATELLRTHTPERAQERIAAGALVPVTENSSYGRVFRLFLERHGRDLHKRATVVVLGDGRTNWVEDGAGVLDSIRARVRSLVWLCPEPRTQWSTGDSAMARFAPKCTEVLEVDSVEALERAAQRLRRLSSIR